VETSLTQRLSRMTFLRPFARSGTDPGQTTSPSRHTTWSFLPLGPAPHTGAKARPPPLTLRRPSTSNASYVTVVRTPGRAPTLVLNLSATGLPSGDLVRAMSEKMRSEPVSPFEAARRSSLVPRIDSDRGRRSSYGVLHRRSLTGSVLNMPVPGPTEGRGLGWSRSTPSSPRGQHYFPPALSGAQRASTLEDRVSALAFPMLPPPHRARHDSGASGLPTEPIASQEASRDPHITIVGTVQQRTTPHPTQRDAASVVLESRGSIVDPPVSPPMPQRRGVVRTDSGVLSKDDPARRTQRTKSIF